MIRGGFDAVVWESGDLGGGNEGRACVRRVLWVVILVGTLGDRMSLILS